MENKAGLMVTFKVANVLGWMVNALVGVSVSQPEPQPFVKTDGVNVTALPVLFVMFTWVVWVAAPAVALYDSDGGLAVTFAIEPMTMVTGTCI